MKLPLFSKRKRRGYNRDALCNLHAPASKPDQCMIAPNTEELFESDDSVAGGAS